MVLRFIESVGERTINFFSSSYEALFFSFTILLNLLNPKSYNTQTQKNLITKIYHSSIVIIPHFIAIAFVFGSIIIGTLILLATEYSMQDKIGSIIVTFVLNEFSAIFTVLFVTLRSSKKEVLQENALSSVLSGVVSVLTLSILFALVMIMSGYIFTFFFMGMDFHTFKYIIFTAIEIQNIVVLLFKSIVFGFIATVIPIYSATKNIKKNRNIAKILISIFFIEIISLLLLKVTNAI
ncbi:MAG: ABC transporter permease [Epsilonproteobacteria bacterium]|nr:MAG: ABC transporter permease [Campylobacterota bacterium]